MSLSLNRLERRVCDIRDVARDISKAISAKVAQKCKSAPRQHRHSMREACNAAGFRMCVVRIGGSAISKHFSK
jgi:hypothetical protein